jgi:ferredoxin
VLHPLVNMAGLGIRDGTLAEMLAAVAAMHQNGVGVYGMKPLGGGHLIGRNTEALYFTLRQPHLDAIAVGMASAEEIAYNCAVFGGAEPPEDQALKLRSTTRMLQVHDWCSGCGTCLEHCPQNALHLRDGRAVAEAGCILCGYCGAHCPDFCLKIY